MNVQPPNPPNPAAPAAGLAGPQLAQALNDHDRAKRSTDIPLFYAQPGRDTIAARLLIVRINDAGAIANWNNDRKLLEFKMCLRDKAVGWFEDLIENRINVDDWDTVKAEFLESLRAKVLHKNCMRQLYGFKPKIRRDHQRLHVPRPAGLQTCDGQKAG